MSTILYPRMLKFFLWEFETKSRYFHLEFLIQPSSGRLKPTCDTRIVHMDYIMLKQV